MAVSVSPISFLSASAFGVVSAKVNTRTTFFSTLETDLENVFLNTVEFAEPVSYTHKTGEALTYNAIFDYPHTSVKLDPEANVSDINTQIRIQESKLKRRPVPGDIVKARGVVYTVEDYRPDGKGLVILYLDRYRNA